MLETLAELCEGPFFFGARPSTLDATVYAFLQSFAGVPFEGPLKDYVCANERLRGYREHVKRGLEIKRARMTRKRGALPPPIE